MAVICKICNKKFLRKFNLTKHMINIHKVARETLCLERNTYKNKCLEMNCNSSFKTNKDLICHLKEIHRSQFEIAKVILKDMDEFASWKTNIEKASNSNYVFKSRCNTSKGQITYYYCNRSQSGKSRNTKKQYIRRLKSQGSAKMQHACTSQIKIITSNGKEEINVVWNKTHYGHTNDLQHIRLSNNDREQIAGRLIKGVTTTEILEDTRNKIGTDLKRVDLLTSQDLYNIKKKYKLVNEKKQRGKDVSIDLWIKECISKSPNENPILYYKKHGDNLTELDKNDFCLVLMNSFQKSMLKKFGNSMIIVDEICDLTGEDYDITFILVVDQSGSGLPVAFMFTNRSDTTTYNIFLNIIKAEIGVVQTNVLMTDIKESVHDTWVNVMGPIKHHLYCPWLVDKAWLNKLNNSFRQEQRTYLFRKLKGMQQETDIQLFEDKLHSMLKYVQQSNENGSTFGNYFKEYFSQNFNKWASCFQADCGLNMNPHLESIHKVIKYLYIHRNITKCLDEGLHLVIKHFRDKNMDKIIKLLKGNNSVAKDISKNHHAAICSIYELQTISENLWILSKHSGNLFIVQKVSDLCCCNITCSGCNICLHMYTCSCYNYLPNVTICKHIHYVILYSSESSVPEQDQLELNQNKFCSDYEDNDAVELNKLVAQTVNKLQRLNLEHIDCTVATQIYYHIDVIESIISSSTCDTN